MSTLPRLLLIDDDADDRALACLLLKEAFPALEVEEVEGAAAFSRALVRGTFGLVICELELAWADGLEVISTLRQTAPRCPIVVLTRSGDQRRATDAVQNGADQVVEKGSRGYLQLPDAVKNALFRANQRRSREGHDTPYRRLVEAFPIGVFTATRDGEILEANPALATILGFPTPESLTQRNLQELFANPAEAERWRTQIGASGGAAEVEAVLRRDDGGTVWARLAAWVVEHPPSDLLQLQGMIQDVSDSKRAQQELTRRNDALSRSCSELEQFASVVSHDLREPLHLMDRYGRMLADKYGDVLNTKGKRYLEHIVHGADRMQRMIDAILELSRVETRGNQFAPVDLEAVVEEARANLEHIISSSGAQVTQDLLPTLAADETQMVQLFQNLIGNAIKFRGAGPPEVHIGARERSEDWLFSVRDHGIGIDASGLERIFEIFQRLHTEDEYQGMGIGLTLCQRIVERHGGKIWAESRPGNGTTFSFTIPKQIGQWP
ncbi:MAG: PAS domain S-box protein [Acidobacteria bacterium]|nr:PAS domain S-box protein [Acidobacteriota bacterium]